jgi:hypothetical protein
VGPTETIREAVTELSNVLVVLWGHPDQETTLAQARIAERQADDRHDAAELLREQS